jgi:hypothetical protein
MHCNVVRWGETIMMVCGRKQDRAPKCWVAHCRLLSTKACDWPMPGGKTCDRQICDTHADHVGPDRDFCPPHSIEDKKAQLKTGP